MPQASEFSKLIDLAIGQGVSHSSVLSDIHARILDRYQTMYPDKPQTVEAVVNEKNGAVKLLAEGKDVTPAEFKPLAEKIARETVIEAVQATNQSAKQETVTPSKTDQTLTKNHPILKAIAQFLFWSYNSFYLVVAIVFLINLITNQLFRTNFLDFIGDLNNFRLLIISLVAIIPLISLATVIWQKKIKKQVFNSGKLLLTFELPSIVLGLMLFNIFKQPSPAITFFIIILLSAIPIIYLHITKQRPKNKKLAAVYFFFQQNLVTTLIYLSALYSFVLPPIAASAIGSINFSKYYFNPSESLIMLLIGLLYFIIAGFILILPFLGSFLAFKAYFKYRRYTTSKWGDQLTKGLSFASLAIFMVLAALVSYQPQQEQYIDQLATINQLDTFEQRQEIAEEMMAQERKVKRILDDAKNLGQRYLFTKDSNFFADEYQSELNLSPAAALMIQESFEALAYPFVYQGSKKEVSQALTNFKYLFGEETDQAKKSIRNQEVIVDNRKINVVTDYDQMLATVTVDEIYSNTTNREQEVVYEFFINGTAVMHDLKLGPDLEFKGRVAPSGAARKLYDQEVRRAKDPALLEQVGPKQYRLSVFPIPGKNDQITLNGKPQRVQFTYTTTLTPKGYSLPHYTQETNVQSVQDFSLILNGEAISAQKNNTFAINEAIQAETTKLCQAGNEQSTKTNLGIGRGYLVTSTDCDTLEERNIFAEVSGKKIALMQDVSYQNKNSQSIQQLIKDLDQEPDLLSNNQVDLFRYNDLLSKANNLTVNNYSDLLDLNRVYFGSSDFAKIINNLDLEYDLIFLWTNANEVPINQLQAKVSSPLYIIHTQTVFPYGSELTAQLWQNNGNVFTSWNEAKEQAAIALMDNLLDETNRQVLAHNAFFKFELDQTNVEPQSQLQELSENPENQISSLNLSTSPNDSLSYLIAQGYIQDQYRQTEAEIEDLNYLDKMQQLSKQAGIISPYSSYIALVNQRQVDDLERFSEKYDRYQEEGPVISDTIFPQERSISPFFSPTAPQMGDIDSNFLSTSEARPGTNKFSNTGFALAGIHNYIMLFIGGNILLIIVAGGVYLVNKKIKRKKQKELN